MSKWIATVDVSDKWKSDEYTTEAQMEYAAQVVDSFSAKWDGDYKEELEMIAEELVDAAESEDVEWFDAVWGQFYDWADDVRVWVKVL